MLKYIDNYILYHDYILKYQEIKSLRNFLKISLSQKLKLLTNFRKIRRKDFFMKNKFLINFVKKMQDYLHGRGYVIFFIVVVIVIILLAWWAWSRDDDDKDSRSRSDSRSDCRSRSDSRYTESYGSYDDSSSSDDCKKHH